MKERQFNLKNGTAAELRSVGEADAEAVCAFVAKAATETDLLAIAKTEASSFNKKQTSDAIAFYDKAKKSIMLGAFIGKEAVAVCTVAAHPHERESHRAMLHLVVAKELWNNGLGTQLLRTAIDFAGKIGFDQLEADAVTESINALILGQKNGMEPVGRFPRAIKLADGQYRDYIRFVKTLKNEA